MCCHLDWGWPAPPHCCGKVSDGGRGSLSTSLGDRTPLSVCPQADVKVSGLVTLMITFLIWSLFPLIANPLTSGDSCCLCLLNFNAGHSKEHDDYLKRQGVMHFRLTVKEKLFKLEVRFAIWLSVLLSLLSAWKKKKAMRIAHLLIFFHYYLLICIQSSWKKYHWIQK